MHRYKELLMADRLLHSCSNANYLQLLHTFLDPGQ